MRGTVTCNLCATETPRRGNTQKYCAPCSEQRDLERKRLHARKVYPKRKEQRSEVTKRGKKIGKAHLRGMTWMDDALDLLWVARFKYPYTQALSKNHIYSGTAKGHRFLRKESRAAAGDIAMLARSSLNRSGQPVRQNKVWVDILVQKPDNKSDAINVVDLVCDGLKIGIGVDDRWFSIRRLDWEIAKTDPHIFVGFGQESDEDVAACSSCGRLLSFEAFRKNRANPNGLDRNCKDCLCSTERRR